MKYTNPILKGFHPDPSICRVDDDFYLVNSTFEFFPGVPIYHSKNLVDWTLVNYCLTRNSQLPLGDCRPSHGVFAPTIRYHAGRFYMITTNVGNGGHFYVYTDDILGEWSDPIWVDQQGIDPSLLFDDDKVYFCATAKDDKGEHCIAVSEIDIETGELLSTPHVISYGTGGTWVEGPHIYHIGKYYYLMTAEGGTSFNHMSCILRGTSPYGPFEESPYGPLITHKDRADTSIHALGHSDLVQDQFGNWFLVSLGFRTIQGAPLHHLGRETFLTSVIFTEDGWPVLTNDGKVEYEMIADLPKEPKGKKWDFIDNFASNKLDLEWSYIRNPIIEHYTLQDGLEIKGVKDSLSDMHPSAVGVRQKEFEMIAEVVVSVDGCGYAGLSAFHNKDYHYDVYLEQKDGEYQVVVSLTMHGMTFIVKCMRVHTSVLKFKITSNHSNYTFYYEEKGEWILLADAKVAGICTEGMMYNTYTGTYVMLFTVDTVAKFEKFSTQYK